MSTMKFWQVGLREIKPSLGCLVSSTFSLNLKQRLVKSAVSRQCLSLQNDTGYKTETREPEKPLQIKQRFVTGNTKHRADLFIRQFSEKSQSLLFAKDAVTLNGVTKTKQALSCKNRVFTKPYINKTLDFVLPNSRFNQVLFASTHFYRLDSNRKLGYLYPTNLDKMSFLFSDLADLPLSLKTYIFLKQRNIHKIGSLITYSQKDLLQLLNRNRKMFAEIKRSSLLTAIYENV